MKPSQNKTDSVKVLRDAPVRAEKITGAMAKRDVPKNCVIIPVKILEKPEPIRHDK